MKNIISIILSSLLCIGVSCKIKHIDEAKAEKIWLEKKGLVVIEAENAQGLVSDPAGWKLNSEKLGYSGSGYITWLGPGDWGPESRPYDTLLLANRKVTYHVKISTPGIYYGKLRNFHFKEDGDNDVWMSVNKGPWGKTYDHQVNDFTFDERGSWAKYNLTEGVYRVELAGRSRNFSVDRIVLFKEGTPETVWSDMNLREALILGK